MGFNIQGSTNPAPRPQSSGGKAANVLKAPSAPVHAAGAGVTNTPNANQLLNDAKAEASATTAGPLQQLAQQIAAQNAQNANATKAVATDFKGLGNYVNQNAGAIQQVGTGLNNTLGQLAQGEQGQLQGITNNSAALMNQYLPKGDTDVGSAGMQSLIGNLAQQQGYATQNMGALQGAAATGQADYQDLGHALAASYATGGRQDLANIQLGGSAKIAPLASKYSDLVDKQGQLAESDLVKLRQQEITNNYHNSQIQVDDVLAGVKQQGANTTAAFDSARAVALSTNANAALARAQAAVTNAKTASTKQTAQAAYWKALGQAATTNANTKAAEIPDINALHQAEANKAAAAGGGNATPLSTNENTRNLALISAAQDALQTLSKKAGGTNKVVAALERGNVAHLPVMPAAYVQAALENLTTGSVSHNTWVQLRNTYGIRNVPFKVAPPVK